MAADLKSILGIFLLILSSVLMHHDFRARWDSRAGCRQNDWQLESAVAKPVVSYILIKIATKPYWLHVN